MIQARLLKERVMMLRSFMHQTASHTFKSGLLLFYSSIFAVLKLKEDMETNPGLEPQL